MLRLTNPLGSHMDRRPQQERRFCIGATAVIVMLLMMIGCHHRRVQEMDAAPKALHLFPYPSNVQFAGDLDVVARRDGGTLRLVNRTPRPYENVQLWLNQEYVALLKRIDIGPDNQFDLSQFINEYGEIYPIGGLLTPEKTRPVVLAEMFEPAGRTRHRLLVRRQD